MILEQNLIFVKGTDTPAAVTKAIPLGQNDLAGDTSGLGPYGNFFLQVMAKADIPAGLIVAVEHADTETGTYGELIAFPAAPALTAGQVVIKSPLPFKVKNWVRLRLSSAVALYAFLTYGVDKGVVDND